MVKACEGALVHLRAVALTTVEQLTWNRNWKVTRASGSTPMSVHVLR